MLYIKAGTFIYIYLTVSIARKHAMLKNSASVEISR